MEFQKFWELYPRKVGKLTAKRSWEKLSVENKQKALQAIVEHRKYWVKKGTDWEFIPHASTWLNQECWILSWSPRISLRVFKTNLDERIKI